MKDFFKISLFFFAFLLFTFAVVQPLNMAGNWYQQFMPNIGGRNITDIIFTDSLTGYAITSKIADTTYILKTTNSGDNWVIIYTDGDSNTFTCIQFLNQNTGFIGGLIKTGSNYHILKTTDSGNSWFNITTPAFTFQSDMHVLSKDTIWFAMEEGLTGGVFRTTDSGASWQQQYYQFNQNPDRIYMYDRNIGFFSKTNMSSLYRTTNSGINWTQITGETGFSDIHFVDSQTGWKAAGTIKKTTNGGLNWVQQTLPSGGIIISTGMFKFSVLNKDTIWGVGGQVFYGGGRTRGTIYRTTNGGINWLFQVPDTSFGIEGYYSLQFINKNIGWCFGARPVNIFTNIHTTNGGDTTWLTPLTQISSEVPRQFKLFQNYPNPFNPITNFGFRIANFGLVSLKIYDVTGKEIAVLINEELKTGEYKTDWDASCFSSGVYFYQLTITNEQFTRLRNGQAKEVYRETKKMVLVK